MIVRKLPMQFGWSQDQLAELTGPSVRTNQRAEHGQKQSLEIANAFASVFEVDLSTFNNTEEHTMNEPVEIKQDEEEALAYAKSAKEYIEGIVAFLIIFLVFAVVFGFQKPMMYWVFLAVAIGLLAQGLIVFEVIRFPAQKLEKWLVERKLGRKL